MQRIGIGALVFLAGAALFSLGCRRGLDDRTFPSARTTTYSTGANGYVVGGGTITSSTTVGGYPVSGVYVGPDGTAVWDRGAAPGYSPYGYSPYGYSPYGYSPYGYSPYGTYTSCTGAVACGSDVSVTVERSGGSVSVGGSAGR